MDTKKIIVGVLGVVLTLVIGGSVYLFATGKAATVVNNVITPVNTAIENVTGVKDFIPKMDDSKSKLNDFDAVDPVEGEPG